MNDELRKNQKTILSEFKFNIFKFNIPYIHNSSFARGRQWPILGPEEFVPCVTSLKRLVAPHCGHGARMVSSSRIST